MKITVLTDTQINTARARLRKLLGLPRDGESAGGGAFATTEQGRTTEGASLIVHPVDGRKAIVWVPKLTAWVERLRNEPSFGTVLTTTERNAIIAAADAAIDITPDWYPESFP